ncbi:WAT1-related protein At2g37460-like [Vigna umbellata]|uniref:WAT1-related protein At2g37460-like n=1 Tax=Vigna umbellata TaxID=87088 RepID=UPI001F5EE877|nr:WAT1-related protein At2g37460-like [Vigna umbellata]
MENQQKQNWFEKAKPFAAVVSIQFGYAIMDVISKAALNKGMSNYVFVVYRQAVAFLVMAPLAWFFESRKAKPKMTLSIFIKILVLSLIEPVIDQNLYFLGMKYTTATFAVTITNMLPAITFIFAWILRLEQVNIRSIRSQAKVVGTVATVSGAMIMTLIKGPVLFGSHGGNDQSQYNGTSTQHTIIGFILMTIGCFCWAFFVILQAITLKTYPAALSLSAWICLTATVEGAAVALVMERGNPSVWSIKFDMRLLCAVYSGITCSGLAYYLQGVVMKSKGPVFVTAFNPLGMVIVAIMGYFLLAEQVFLGRMTGAVIICLGLYFVVWGKSKDNYGPEDPNTQEPIEEMESAKKENFTCCTHGVTTATNLGNGNTTPSEEQV